MESKCNYKILQEAEIGSVKLCKSCGGIRIEIGCLMSLLSAHQFRLILADFQNRHEFYHENATAEELAEPVIIRLNNNNLFLNLLPEEFEEVLELFKIANHMLEVNELISSC